MNPIVLLVFILAMGLVSVLAMVLKNKRAGSEKYQQILVDFRQSAEALLDADEQIEALCGYKPCAAVTSKRLLVSTKNGIDSVAFSSIKKLNGMNASGYNTKNPDNMLVFQIKADQKYTLGNQSEEFDRLVNLLYQRTGL